MYIQHTNIISLLWYGPKFKLLKCSVCVLNATFCPSVLLEFNQNCNKIYNFYSLIDLLLCQFEKQETAHPELLPDMTESSLQIYDLAD